MKTDYLVISSVVLVYIGLSVVLSFVTLLFFFFLSGGQFCCMICVYL